MDLNPQQTLPGVKPRRADAIYQTRADKQAAYRDRHDMQAVTIQLPRAMCVELGAYLSRTGKPKSKTIEKLIETQLLRKR
jgi:hypothetical protein